MKTMPPQAKSDTFCGRKHDLREVCSKCMNKVFLRIDKALGQLESSEELLKAAQEAHSLLYKLGKRNSRQALALRQALAKVEGR